MSKDEAILAHNHGKYNILIKCKQLTIFINTDSRLKLMILAVPWNDSLGKTVRWINLQEKPTNK